ncbi:hypothetical protein ACFW4O_36215 [Streptomyces mutabilis]|uniref:hypothetical protein n=1 Tax=Streptomyces mutabilis TaxID=67332 RepID=UPI0036771934
MTCPFCTSVWVVSSRRLWSRVGLGGTPCRAPQPLVPTRAPRTAPARLFAGLGYQGAEEPGDEHDPLGRRAGITYAQFQSLQMGGHRSRSSPRR